jgi:hypothetical protein
MLMHGLTFRRQLQRASSTTMWPALVSALVLLPAANSATCEQTGQVLANATSCERAPLCNVSLGYYATWSTNSLAGNRIAGSGHVDGVGAAARLFAARDSGSRGSLSFAPDGSKVFFADTENHAVREISLSTNAVSTLRTASYNFTFPFTVLPSPDGSQQIIADQLNVKLVWQQMANTLESAAAPHQLYWGASLSPDGTAYAFGDIDIHLTVRIRRRAISGGAGSGPYTELLNKAHGSSPSVGYSWGGLAFSPDGKTIVFADQVFHAVHLLTVATASTTTLAGEVGVAGFVDGTQARFDTPHHAAWSPDGAYVVVADTNNYAVRLITVATGSVATLAGNGTLGYASTHPALFGRVTGVAFDPTQSTDSPVIAVADASNFEIRLLGGPSCTRDGEEDVDGDGVVCPAGYEGSASGKCLLCPVGKFKAATGPDSCSSCPIGKYGSYWNNGAGVVETSCDPCPANSNTTTHGSTIDQCQCAPWHVQFPTNRGNRTTATAPNSAAIFSMQGPGWMPGTSDNTRKSRVWFAMPRVGFPSAVQEAMLLHVGGGGNSVWYSSAPPPPHPLVSACLNKFLSPYSLSESNGLAQGRNSIPVGYRRVSSAYTNLGSFDISRKRQVVFKCSGCRRF